MAKKALVRISPCLREISLFGKYSDALCALCFFGRSVDCAWARARPLLHKADVRRQSHGREGPEAGKDGRAAFSHPAPHPRDIVVIGRAKLAAHLGFLERNVDPIDSSEDGERRDEHRPGTDPYGNAQ
jgi:hypothetical protein